MKSSTVLSLVILSLVLAVGTTGCHKGKVRTTPIPNSGGKMKGGSPTGLSGLPGDGRILSEDQISDQPIPVRGIRDIGGRTQEREPLLMERVYFELDSATIKRSEKEKLKSVADFFKIPANAEHDLLIEGHCDERGTEGYNLSLGERRALATREYLAALGVPADHIHTISFGEIKPAAHEHSESAWKQNRRCEFVVVLPAGQ